MGFFADIASETRKNTRRTDTPQAAPSPGPGPGPAPAPAPVPFPAPEQASRPQSRSVPEQAPRPQPESVPEQERPPRPGSAPEREEPGPVIDLTPGSDAPDAAEDEAGRRRDHDAAEARRKAEFDAKQAEKKAKRQAQLDRINAMSDEELFSAAIRRVAADTERLTRRNMKEAVAGHIQAKCREDAAFAMLVMDPEKSMANCFQYINRKAREYAEQEMKDNGIERTGVYGTDVPDGLCFQWAEDYFNDPDAKEDRKNDEKFIPKPFVPAAPANRKKTPGKTAKKPAPVEKPKVEKPSDAGGMEQISLM